MDTALWDTEATTSARGRLMLSQRLNPRLMLMPTMAGEAMALATEAMVDTVWDTPDTMVDMVWDTPLVPMDTALWDTEATTSARGRLMLSQRLSPRLMLMPTMAGEAMALATGAMVDTVWDTPDMDTEATTLARERLRLSQRPNPRLMLMPGMVLTVWDTPDSMVDTVWDTPDSMVDTAVLDTAATTLARERP